MLTGIVVLASISIVICVLVLFKNRKEETPVVRPAAPKVPVQQTQQTRPTPIEPARPQSKPAVTSPPTEALKAPAVIDVQSALVSTESRNERILAGISENIRKNLQSRPVANHSPIVYADSKSRNTEYVRVKREIITPHGHIRFSILKDWLSTNMLAIFRRASMEWKTPDDLIALIPPYLEPNAEE